MIKTTRMLNSELKAYTNPGDAIRRMVVKGTLVPVRHGLYETDPNVPGYCLSTLIYGPSYLSFEYALSYYGLIPEGTTRYTSASFRKHKKKEYITPFGIFSYQDIPESAYPWEIRSFSENGYPLVIAAPEKALCDKLYTVSPMKNRREMEEWLFEDMRIDISLFSQLDMQILQHTAALYHTVNHRIFESLIRRESKNAPNH